MPVAYTEPVPLILSTALQSPNDVPYNDNLPPLMRTYGLTPPPPLPLIPRSAAFSAGTVIFPLSLTKIPVFDMYEPVDIIAALEYDESSIAQPTAVRVPLPSTVIFFAYTAAPLGEYFVAFALSTPVLCTSTVSSAYTILSVFTVPPFTITESTAYIALERGIVIAEFFILSTPSPLNVIEPSPYNA